MPIYFTEYVDFEGLFTLQNSHHQSETQSQGAVFLALKSAPLKVDT
jgi:hypothetical protein